MVISGRGQTSTQALVSFPKWFLGKRCALGYVMGPPPLLRALERDQNWVPDPASSAGPQGRNVPFREDMVESVIRTIVSVANNHPSMLPSLETVDGNEPQPSSPEILPRVRSSMRNGMEYVDPWQEVSNLFQQELLLQDPTRYIEGGILRNTLSVQTLHSMLVNREECGTQVQPRSDQDRLVAALADHSCLNWQGVPHSLKQMLNHLPHQSSQSCSDTPESWDNG